MVLTLYLLRHGETELSRQGGFCGDLDPALTEAGALMAADFAAAYADQPWQAIYSSPKQRALCTAQPLCKRLGMDPQVRPGLREISFGEWEGLATAPVQAQDAYVRWMTEPAWNAPPSGETAVQVAYRAMAVITEIQQQFDDGLFLLVSHKATIRLMLSSLLGIDLGRYRDRLDVPVASVSVVSFRTYGPRLERLGDRYHLRPELRGLPGT